MQDAEGLPHPPHTGPMRPQRRSRRRHRDHLPIVRTAALHGLSLRLDELNAGFEHAKPWCVCNGLRTVACDATNCPPNRPGLRTVAFEVDNVRATVAGLRERAVVILIRHCLSTRQPSHEAPTEPNSPPGHRSRGTPTGRGARQPSLDPYRGAPCPDARRVVRQRQSVYGWRLWRDSRSRVARAGVVYSWVKQLAHDEQQVALHSGQGERSTDRSRPVRLAT